MATLTDPQKVFIVERLACFASHAEIIEAVRETYGLNVSRQQLQRYDPATVNGKALSAELRAVFERTRESYLRETGQIPIAHQAFRLRLLQKLLDDNARNPDLRMRLLEQAAREVGGCYTRRREITGKDGGPVAVEFSFEGWSVEELEAYAVGGLAAVNALRKGSME